jgi:branched-subunit amino acid aminotransferase/4-amino-4-deoxychorismate lyase
LELARAAGFPVREEFLPVGSLYTADEVFLTGTTVEVLAVVQVDGRMIGDGRPGPVVGALASRWAALTGESPLL